MKVYHYYYYLCELSRQLSRNDSCSNNFAIKLLPWHYLPTPVYICLNCKLYQSRWKNLPSDASIPHSSHNSFLSIDRSILDRVLPFRNICHEMSHQEWLFLRLVGTSGMTVWKQKYDKTVKTLRYGWSQLHKVFQKLQYPVERVFRRG